MADEPEKSDDVEELMKLLGVDPEKVETPAPDPAAAPTEEIPVEGTPASEGEASAFADSNQSCNVLRLFD